MPRKKTTGYVVTATPNLGVLRHHFARKDSAIRCARNLELNHGYGPQRCEVHREVTDSEGNTSLADLVYETGRGALLSRRELEARRT